MELIRAFGPIRRFEPSYLLEDIDVLHRCTMNFFGAK